MKTILPIAYLKLGIKHGQKTVFKKWMQTVIGSSALAALVLAIAYVPAAAQYSGNDQTRRLEAFDPPQYDIAVVKVNIGNLRSSSSTDAAIAGKVQKGDKVEILEQAANWYRVKLLDGRVGWLHQMLLAPAELSLPSSLIYTSGDDFIEQTGKIKVAIARIRAMPTTDAQIKFKLRQDADISAIGISDDWYHIRIKDGRTGWAHKSLLSLIENDPLEPEPKAMTIKGIRSEAVSASEERVILELSDFFAPKVSVATGDNPKVICEFPDAITGPLVQRIFSIDGNLIRQISVEGYGESNTSSRIIISLVPDANYHVQPLFYREENQYVLVIEPKE